MSVLSYLNDRASTAVLSDDERESINKSIETISDRLSSYFSNKGDGLIEKFRFGSSTRGTILPRKIDANSDIDYLIVFEKGGLKPQSYLDRLKRFAETRYSTSELYQSSPSIVLELGHIKFDLVPALKTYNNYYIPSGGDSWRSTDPNDFNKALEKINKDNRFLIKPTIRLAKIWNAANNYIYDSFLFEKWIKDLSFWQCANQSEYLFTVFDYLVANTDAQWRNDRITRAKQIISQVRQYKKENISIAAEVEVKKLIPDNR